MTTFLIIAGLSWIVFVDAAAFKRRHGELYFKIFRFEPAQWAFLTLIFYILTVPLYLLRRLNFKKEISCIIESEIPIEEKTDWRILTDAAGILMIWVFVVTLFSLGLDAVSSFSKIFETKLDEIMAVSVFYSPLMVWLIYQMTYRAPYPGFLNSVGLRRGNQSIFRVFVVPVFVGIGLAAFSAFLMLHRSEIPETPLSEALNSAKSPSTLISFLGLALLAAPFLEEIIFRGYFFAVLKRLKGTQTALWTVSLTFALFHFAQYWGDIVAIFIVTLLGVALTWIRIWSGSAISSVITHYTYNILITMIPIAVLIFSNLPYLEYQVFYDHLNDQRKEELLIQAIGRDPDLSDGYNDLAWLYANENKNLGTALDLVEEALTLDSQNEAYWDTEAEVLYRLKRFREAVQIEESLVEDYPKNGFFKTQFQKFKKALEEHPEQNLSPEEPAPFELPDEDSEIQTL